MGVGRVKAECRTSQAPRGDLVCPEAWMEGPGSESRFGGLGSRALIWAEGLVGNHNSRGQG